jgi:transcriptional regulator with XRE-family HTH domain
MIWIPESSSRSGRDRDGAAVAIWGSKLSTTPRPGSSELEELARRLRVPQSFVSKYERGERRLELAEAILILEHLGVSLRTFSRRLESEQALQVEE